MARTKSTRREYEEYVFHITAPSVHYSFSIEQDRKLRELEPFNEHETLQFETECIWPDRFKGRKGTATVWPDPILAEPRKLAPDAVDRGRFGYIHATRSVFETSLSLPPQACWRLGQAIASGLISSMLTNGKVDARSFNRITSVSFHGQEFDPVAYVG